MVVVLVVRAVLGNSSQFSRSLQLLAHPAPLLVALAVVAEAASYLSYAAAQQRLGRAAGHRLGLTWLASLALAAQALVDFLPAGYVAANVLNFRELRRRGMPVALCAWLLGITSLLYIGVLLALACFGAVIDHNGGWVPRALGAGGLVVLGALALVATDPGPTRSRRLQSLARLPLAVMAWLERRQGRAARLAVSSRDVATQMSQTRLTRAQTASATALFGTAWLADAACLTCGFAALGGVPPWNALLVAYAVAQLVSFLPVTPGGFGLVEGSLAVTLTGGGRTLSDVLAAVLLYRGISYWATLPVGALGYLGLHRARSRRGKEAASNP